LPDPFLTPLPLSEWITWLQWQGICGITSTIPGKEINVMRFCVKQWNSTGFFTLIIFKDIREGKSLDDKKTLHFLLIFFANFHFFVSFPQAHARTLQNHSISPHANTVQNNAVESSTKFYGNLMLFINWVYEM
jgi:hypothetical protein